MYRQQWMALIGLALSAFIMNTSEFMPIGLLVDIAGSFAMTEAEAGLIVSIYAWAVALLALRGKGWVRQGRTLRVRESAELTDLASVDCRPGDPAS